MGDKVVLLVEDNPDDEALCIRALRKANIRNEIVVAHDGQEALDLLFGAKCPVPIKPAVVLLDLKLPKLDGVETLTRIRANPKTRTLPVVMLTTSDQDTDIARAYASGANSYVRKPIDFNEFANVATQLGVYWLLINKEPGAEAIARG
jgi:two-component system response regulator